MKAATLDYYCPCGTVLPIEAKRRGLPWRRELRFTEAGLADLWAHFWTHGGERG